jgi:predicted nucleic acid-binding protein
MYLLDTNVVSEFRRARPHGAVMAWIGSIREDQLFVSAVTMFELQVGAEMTRRQDVSRASELYAWIDTIPGTFQILPSDDKTFRRAAQLLHGKSLDLLGDGLIAATALVHNLTVVTRNLRDFAPFDVPTLDPFRN